jgi:hypothetical protein
MLAILCGKEKITMMLVMGTADGSVLGYKKIDLPTMWSVKEIM